jgi:hypothetical protein
MESNVFKGTALIVAGFGAGLICSCFPRASAATDPTPPTFRVNIFSFLSMRFARILY